MLARNTVEPQQKRPVGRPKKNIDSFLSKIIEEFYAGNRDAAAAAWELKPGTLRVVTQGHKPVSPALKIRIHLSTQIPIAELEEKL